MQSVCIHCYSDASPDSDIFYPVDNLPKIARESAELGFRHLVITGGKPLVHPQREKILDVLLSIRQDVKPMLTVLRTNLTVLME